MKRALNDAGIDKVLAVCNRPRNPYSQLVTAVAYHPDKGYACRTATIGERVHWRKGWIRVANVRFPITSRELRQLTRRSIKQYEKLHHPDPCAMRKPNQRRFDRHRGCWLKPQNARRAGFLGRQENKQVDITTTNSNDMSTPHPQTPTTPV